MSAIFGFVYFDGRPSASMPADTMVRAMSKWGPDGVSISTEGPAVLGFANLAISPESMHERLPVLDEQRGVLLTASGRLDNRDELRDLFRIPGHERESVPDGRLLIQAYLKWGGECPRRIFGDWSLAAWDGRRRRLFLARDQLGNTGLYYFHRPPFFAFAPAPEALLGLPGVERRIDERRLASYLTFVGLTEGNETFWEDIRSVPAGFSMEVSPEGEQTKRYWEMNPRPPLDGLSDGEYVSGFLERYRAAVRVRLRSSGPIGTTLSCGLDSGSVTALAAEALKERGQGITAFTSVPIFPASHLTRGARDDEWPLAREVAARYDNIDHLAIDGASISPLAGIERAVSVFRAPQIAAANEFWIFAVHDEARARGIRVMLTGQLGNGGVSWSGGTHRIFYLFASGKWDEGIRAMKRWKERSGRSWIRTIAGRLVIPLLRPYWENARRILAKAPPWEEYSSIHPDFAKRMKLAQVIKEKKHDPTLSRPIEPFEERKLVLVRNGTHGGPVWHQFGAAFGMEVRDPTGDFRLLEYCLGVPEGQDVFEGGERMLMRRAMEGILPPEVRWNRVRGRQAADVAYRLLHHGEEMEAMLHRLAANPEVAAYLDLALMRRVWRELQGEVTADTSERAMTCLLRGVMCGCFVERAGSG